MRLLFISEWIKTTSTKMWWILALVAAAFTLLLGIVPGILLSGLDESIGLSNPAAMAQLWSSLGGALVIALILGIVAMTGEYRHKTITDTFLTEPRRLHLVSAKAAVQAIMGVFVAITCVVLGIVVALALLPTQTHAPIDWGLIGEISIGVIIAFALYAVLGVAVGALINNQVVAIVIGLLWVVFIEPILVGFLPDVGKWLPGGAAASVLQGTTATGADLLAPWLGGLLLLGYAAVFAVVGARTTLRRDIT